MTKGRICSMFNSSLWIVSFDDLVGRGQDRLWESHADRLRRLQVDHDFEFGRPLDGKVLGPDALQYLVHIVGPEPPSRRLAIRRRNASDDFSFASSDFKVLGAFFLQLPSCSLAAGEFHELQ